jgi:hypothetical protein
MVSQIKTCGVFMLPTMTDATRFNIDMSTVGEMPREEYCARILASMLQAALDQASAPGGLLVNYRQMPQAVGTTISEHFGVSWTDSELERMQQVTKLDAKNPFQTFTPDQEEKRRAVTEQIAAVTREWLTPLYDRLEAVRAQSVR